MRWWWLWVGIPVVLGVMAGAATTLLTDRAWGSELAPRCVMFSIAYLAVRPAMHLRRSAQRGERMKGDNEEKQGDRDR